ncbi:thiamine pyrophosphate-dependent acetolactate synthase large subunit-like protein [Streptomyces sp. V3I7]|nr:thiamine pyrophosphate-dependent acetolactate synthase large subunit-like protein [Streptomyces sp. V3I7]
MLLIGGQGALAQHRMGSLQDLPHVDMMTPIIKFAANVPDSALPRSAGEGLLRRVRGKRCQHVSRSACR